MENFNNITHVPLRNYNRAVMATNIMEDAGKEACQEYLEQFSNEERTLIFSILFGIKQYGFKKIKEMCTANVEFEDVSHLEDIVDA